MRKIINIFFLVLLFAFIIYANEELSVDQKLTELVKNIPNMKKVNQDLTLMAPKEAGNSVQYTWDKYHNSEDSPHLNKYIYTYVNKTGEIEFYNTNDPFYPEGTVIITEQYGINNRSGRVDTIPELYTIMIKREEGYNPDYGDWEFGVIDKYLNNGQMGKIQACMDCHAGVSEMDYVFRYKYFKSNSLWWKNSEKFREKHRK